jgi:D-alanyl-D-alanine carboxypeptidase
MESMASLPKHALRVLALACLLCVLTLAPAAAAQSLAGKAVALDQALGQAMDYLNMPGAVVLVRAPDGGQWRTARGVARIERYNPPLPGPGPDEAPWSGSPMRQEMHFRIASTTKTFTATLVLMLAQEKRLGLNDTVFQWLGEIAPASRKITIRNLLNMTSGLYDYAAYKPFLQATLRHPLRRYTPRELISMANLLGRGRMRFAPGTDWRYCNTNYILLGLIIEKAAAQSFRQALTQRILRPLGLTHTSAPAPDDATLPAPHAHGYFFPDDSPQNWVDLTRLSPTGPWSAGEVISSADDLLVWLRALVRGSLLNPALRREMFTWTSTRGRHQYGAYGLGVINYHGAVGHTGSIPGFRSAILHYQGYDFVILLNAYRTVAAHQGHYGLYIFDRLREALDLAGQESDPLHSASDVVE